MALSIEKIAIMFYTIAGDIDQTRGDNGSDSPRLDIMLRRVINTLPTFPPSGTNRITFNIEWYEEAVKDNGRSPSGI